MVSVLPSVAEPEPQRLCELRQPQCHQGKDPLYLPNVVLDSVYLKYERPSSFTEIFQDDEESLT